MTRILTIIALLFATPAWAVYHDAVPCEAIDFEPVEVIYCFSKELPAERFASDGPLPLFPKLGWHSLINDFRITGYFRVFGLLENPLEGKQLNVMPQGSFLVSRPVGDKSYFFKRLGMQIIYGNAQFTKSMDRAWIVGDEYTFYNDEDIQTLMFSSELLKSWVNSHSIKKLTNSEGLSVASIEKFLDLFQKEEKTLIYQKHSTGLEALFPNPPYFGMFGYIKNGESRQNNIKKCRGDELKEFFGQFREDFTYAPSFQQFSYCRSEDGSVRRRKGILGTKKFEKNARQALSVIFAKAQESKNNWEKVKRQMEALANDGFTEAELAQAEKRVAKLRDEAIQQTRRAERERKKREREAERRRIAEEERLQKAAQKAERRRIAEEERLQKAAQKAAKLARERKMAPFRAKCDGFGYKRATPQFNQCVSDQEALMELKETTINKRQEEQELQRLEMQRKERAEREQLKAIERATRETNARIAQAQENARRQQEEQRRMQASQNMMNLGLSIMNGGLGNQGYSAAPAPRIGTTGCFLQGSRVSGFNRICTYNCTGSQLSDTIASTSICPLSRN